ncbi:protein FAF-like, chloroplastic [Diospyros lotus]|uniref:protein FAF-like, chloroplastic n=1 Tax=Diospyros lotus TaxID=55363 RepID=UPI00225A89B5|nr:protein FAF-like, chloroplastic [Diospyros lotus]
MSGTTGKSLPLSNSPLKAIEEAAKAIEKQGIGSILASDCPPIRAAASLRRALSADMSSKKWLSPLKKTASAKELGALVEDSSSSEEEDEEEEQERPAQFGSWTSILLSQKAGEDESKLPPPYIHPLVKRSANSLSETSLLICTESLGSETGSDGFSSYAGSESGEPDQEEKDIQPQSRSFDEEELRVVNYSYANSKKMATARSFPPPIPSLARSGGPSLHMQSRRDNGRLVLEVVSVPSLNCFRAHRQDGRLLLTFAAGAPEEMVDDQDGDVLDDEMELEEEEQEVFQTEEEEGNGGENFEEEKEIGFVMEQAPEMPRGSTINFHRSAMAMKKLMGMEYRNPTWTLVDEEEATKLSQSLPRLTHPPPATAAVASSFNEYNYFWRTKPALINPLIAQNVLPLRNNSNKKPYDQTLVLRGNKADFLIPLLKSCKEQRRSLLIWEPPCIATS